MKDISDKTTHQSFVDSNFKFWGKNILSRGINGVIPFI